MAQTTGVKVTVGVFVRMKVDVGVGVELGVKVPVGEGVLVAIGIIVKVGVKVGAGAEGEERLFLPGQPAMKSEPPTKTDIKPRTRNFIKRLHDLNGFQLYHSICVERFTYPLVSFQGEYSIFIISPKKKGFPSIHLPAVDELFH